MKQIPIILFMILTAARAASQPVPEVSDRLVNRYWWMIESPHSPFLWDQWRTDLRQWKDTLLASVHYDARYYKDPANRWASGTYACYFLMANDRSLYDSTWNYKIGDCLQKYETRYGGVDIVLLWATYPQLGFDNRDQYTFYRGLPGGIKALRKLCAELHTMGKKFLIAYNPWDAIARNNGKIDEEELIALVKEIGADGIFLDTISSVAGFREKLDRSAPGVIFQSEITPEPARLAEVEQSWMELPVWYGPFKNAEYDEVPGILRSRWLEQKHLVYHLSRWSHEQTNIFQNAWMNGAGVVIWENVFGTVNELNARDGSMLRSMLPLLRRYSVFFTEGKWTPLCPTHLERVYANLWEKGNQRLWTIINRQEQSAQGPLLDLETVPGTRYFDLVRGRELEGVVREGKTWISVDLAARAIGGILAVPEGELPADFESFLQQQAAVLTEASSDASYRLPEHVLSVVPSTRLYPADRLPPGMTALPVPADSFKMAIHFRQRECGFYPAEGVTDISYTMTLDQPGTATRKVKLSSYAMDETPVTNAAFYEFIRAAHYRPAFSENFLRHWKNGRPPRGLENHPVTWVSLEDARAFAAWAGKRLPTEEEWQWAAQGGEQGFRYPWGDQYDSTRCNHGQTSGTTAVRRFPAGRTTRGLYDMSGNVWQFTESERSDGHNRYCILRGGSWYVTRGSGWYADQGPQQTSFGSKYLFTWPGLDRCATVGFRCVVDMVNKK